MLRFISHTFKMMTFILFVCVSAPSFGLMQNQNIHIVRSDYEEAYSQRTKLSGTLTGLESEYLTIVRRVDVAKKNINSITGRLELEGLLRRSKDISAKLRAIQIRMSALNSRIESKRTVIVRHIKNDMKKLERSLAVIPKEQRASVVKELNRLRKEKVQFNSPLPAIQTRAQEDLALRDADALSDDPDELFAVADELEDSKDQLSKRLVAIDNQIAELKRTQKLMRRSDSFSSEDQFFEESDRARVIAKYDVVQKTMRVVKETDDAQNGSFNNASQNNAFEASASDGLDSSNAKSADVVGDAPTTDPAPQFEQIETTERVRINGSGDPSRSVSSRKLDTKRNMKSRIKSLESEKQKLTRRVKRLKKRAQRLRKRANSL